MVLLPPCSLYGAATLRPPPLGPGRGLTLPCGRNNAALVVMDELGRGTSTFDGVSIAYAVARPEQNPRPALCGAHS